MLFLNCLPFNIFITTNKTFHIAIPQNLSTKHLTFVSHVSTTIMLSLQTTEGLNMPADTEELFNGRTFLVENVSCERPCGSALHLATGLCFF